MNFNYTLILSICLLWASQVVQWINNLPAMQETWVRFPGLEDPLQKGMAVGWCTSRGHWASQLVAQRVRSLPAMHRPGFDPWFGKISWRRKWQLTPVFLPGKSHGQRSLVGYSPWGGKETDRRIHNFHHILTGVYN